MSKTLDARVALKNDTAVNWTSANPILLKGEMGVEIDTRKFKFGDGVTAWNSLTYGNIASLSDLGITATSGELNYMDGVTSNVQTQLDGKAPTNHASTENTYGVGSGTNYGHVKTGTANPSAAGTANPGTDNGVVARADHAHPAQTTVTGNAGTATKLATARAIAISGDGTGTQNFDGSAGISISLVLANSGVGAGTYTKVTVDAKGRVTVGASLSADDIPSLTLAKISNAGTAAAVNTGTASGNVPVLDANGKLSTAVLPALAITDTFVVASQAAMLALSSANVGDIAVRTDQSKSYILAVEGYSTLANWQELLTPTDSVSSVNSKTGAVTLTTDDIGEGSTNKYYTDARVQAKVETMASTSLTDSSAICRTTDDFILDCGNATL